MSETQLRHTRRSWLIRTLWSRQPYVYCSYTVVVVLLFQFDANLINDEQNRSLVFNPHPTAKQPDVIGPLFIHSKRWFYKSEMTFESVPSHHRRCIRRIYSIPFLGEKSKWIFCSFDEMCVAGSSRHFPLCNDFLISALLKYLPPCPLFRPPPSLHR